MDLNDKLINLKHFNCVECNQFLYVPVMHKGDCKNMCVDCFKKQTDKDEYVKNVEIEEIIKLLKVPCRYDNCPLQLPYEEMFQHYDACEYKTWNCSSFGNDCTWSGLKNEIVKHFEQSHEESLIKSNNFQFDHIVDLNDNIVENKLLWCDNESFLLHIKNDTNNINFVIYHIHQTDNNFNYRIVYNYTENFKMKQKIKKPIDKFDSRFDGTFVSENSINFDSNPFKRLNINNIEFNIQILYVDTKLRLDYNVLKNFECPICENYMHSKIYQCITGHSICMYCFKNINKCPTCSSNYENCRNYALEKVSVNVIFPCKYQENGCKVILKGDQIEKHDNYCSYKIIECPKCGWRDISLKFVRHFKEKHNIQENNNLTFSNNSNIISEYIIAYKNLFAITNCTADEEGLKTMNWLCTQITGIDKYKFNYQIKYENSEEKFIKRKRCFKYLSGRSSDANVAKFNELLISQYSLITIEIFM